MEVIASFLLLLLFLLALFNPLFFPPSKLLPWIRSFLLSASHFHSRTRSGEKREEYDGLAAAFTTFDSNEDGFISEEELVELLRQLGLAASGGEVRSMMEKADTNGDGLIDFEEFRELWHELWGVTGGAGGDDEEGLHKAFRVFDIDDDGKISAEELSKVLKSLGIKEGDRAETCLEMIRKVDLNGDGMVCFDEFKRMMAMKIQEHGSGPTVKNEPEQ